MADNAQPVDASPYLNQDEAASFLKIKSRTLEYHRYMDTGPTYYKIVGAIRYRLDDLIKYANDNGKRKNPDDDPKP